MFKIKLLIGLAVVMTTFAVSTGPASAKFVSNNQNGQGKVKVFPEKTVFRTGPGAENPKIECKNNGQPRPQGEWHVQAKEWKKQEVTGVEYQEQVKEGPHLGLKITSWGACKGPTGFTVEVKCKLQAEQGQPLTSSWGSVYSGCIVEIGPAGGNHCYIKVPSSPTTNRELTGVSLENIGTNEVGMEANVTGITSELEEVGGLCTTLHIEKGSSGTFKTEGGKIIVEGVKLV